MNPIMVSHFSRRAAQEVKEMWENAGGTLLTPTPITFEQQEELKGLLEAFFNRKCGNKT